MSTVAKYRQLLESIGRASISALFPNEFEYYLVALELVDSKGETIDYFSFPVVPNITKSMPQIVNIRKTLGGIAVNSTSSFVPKDYTLQGDFGRKFRIMLNEKIDINFSAISFSTISGAFKKENLLRNLPSIKNQVFSPYLKTGYGAIKILEAIIEKANLEDPNTGKPYRLYFYNPTLGENFLIEPINLTLSQTKDRNMIWGFTLTFKAIAPLEGLVPEIDKSLVDILTTDNLEKASNKIVSSLYNLVIRK